MHLNNNKNNVHPAECMWKPKNDTGMFDIHPCLTCTNHARTHTHTQFYFPEETSYMDQLYMSVRMSIKFFTHCNIQQFLKRFFYQILECLWVNFDLSQSTGTILLACFVTGVIELVAKFWVFQPNFVKIPFLSEFIGIEILKSVCFSLYIKLSLVHTIMLYKLQGFKLAKCRRHGRTSLTKGHLGKCVFSPL